MNICKDCIHAYTLEHTPNYRRCELSAGTDRSTETLCGEMRKPGAPCGPAGTLWEAQEGTN